MSHLEKDPCQSRPEDKKTTDIVDPLTSSLRRASLSRPSTADLDAKEGTAAKARNGLLFELYDWMEVLIVSIAVVFSLFSFFFRIAVVDGDSMKNTLHNGEKLFLQELFYTPKQGDIIVCQDEYFGFEKPIVKRIIATEGQTVSINCETWEVTVDGVVLEEDYVNRKSAPMLGWSYGESYTVPEGHVFVMGDNRNESRDSRDGLVGAIDERYIIGKVVFRLLPLSKFGIVN